MSSHKLPAVPALGFRETLHASDREAVARITASSGFFTEEELAIALEVFDDALAEPQTSGYYYALAESAGRIAGYACWGPIEQTVSSFDLFWIVVDDAVRHLGVGRKLLEFAERRARAQGCVRLYVETAGRDQYLPTRRFYERSGYTMAAHLDHFYADNDAKVIYVKTLAG